MNPIFIEYYAHEGCDCYKVKNPWTRYLEEKIVLCRVDEGLETASKLAKEVLERCLTKALSLSLEPV